MYHHRCVSPLDLTPSFQDPSSPSTSSTTATLTTESQSQPSLIYNRADNLNPKIIRKHETKSQSLKLKSHENLDFNKIKSCSSAPVSPGTEESPKTPLSERALKLLKAKEEFFNPIRNVVKNRDHWANRLSQISMNSEVVQNDGMLMKSASVGILGSPKQDNQHPSGYTSLPRNTKSPTSTDNEGKESSNESKNRNRFGLSNIASKLRKVKLRRSSKDLTKMNVVSTLCRQSLMVDITGAVKNPTVTGFPGHSDSEDSTRTVRPVSSESSLTGGQSTPTTSISSSQSGFTLRFRNKTRNVKKSKSTNIVDENLK